MLRALPPAISPLSSTTTSKPRSISSCAALIPATPPPRMMTRDGMLYAAQDLKKRNDRVGLLYPQRHFLAHTEEVRRCIGHLQDLERHVRCDDELDRRTAERHHHTAVLRKHRATKQRSAAQERDDLVLRQHVSSGLGGYHMRKIIVAKHHRERPEVAAALQEASSPCYRGRYPWSLAWRRGRKRPDYGPRQRNAWSQEPGCHLSAKDFPNPRKPRDRQERGSNDRGWWKKVWNQPPEHHCVLETRKDVRGAPKQVQHASHLRVGHLRAAQVHLDLQGREPHCALIVDGYSLPLLTEVGGRQ